MKHEKASLSSLISHFRVHEYLQLKRMMKNEMRQREREGRIIKS